MVVMIAASFWTIGISGSNFIALCQDDERSKIVDKIQGDEEISPSLPFLLFEKE